MPQVRHCCDSVVPANAARLFRRHAEILDRPPVVKLLRRFAGSPILEIGAGCLRNALYLQAKGFRITVVEVEGIADRFRVQYRHFVAHGGELVRNLPGDSRYPLAVATFVFETICRPRQRLDLLRRVHECLTPGGILIASTRGPADLVTARASGKPCSDGFLTPNLTFARSFTRDQFRNFLRSGRFSRVDFLHKTSTKAPEYLHALAWKSSPDLETP
jgi:SAM-dependent methyltransferase